MNKFLFFLSCIFFAGCVTAYSPNGFKGGFNEIKLQEDIYKISFAGNGYTSQEKVMNFAYLRSAELTLEKGCKYFLIVEKDTYESSSRDTFPAFEHINIIKIYKEKPIEEKSALYDAQQIRDNLRQKYKL